MPWSVSGATASAVRSKNATKRYLITENDAMLVPLGGFGEPSWAAADSRGRGSNITIVDTSARHLYKIMFISPVYFR